MLTRGKETQKPQILFVFFALNPFTAPPKLFLLLQTYKTNLKSCKPDSESFAVLTAKLIGFEFVDRKKKIAQTC